MKKIFIFVIILAILIGGLYWLGKNNSISVVNDTSGASDQPKGVMSGRDYANTKYKFGVTLPEGFMPREIYTEESDTILFEKGSDGVQIMVSPFEDIKELTADMIRADIPDMKIEQVQVVDIGSNYKGVAFLGDNPEFDGASRDVWFVFKGNLYQISTYARLDATLQSIFSTWKFF